MPQEPLGWYFPNFSFAIYFCHRGSAGITKPIWPNLITAPKNQQVDPFPDPLGHLEAPWCPFWIFEVQTEGIIKYKADLAKADRIAQNKGLDPRLALKICGPLKFLLEIFLF